MTILENIKEITSAYYDPNTNKIIGCREYSIVWWHEKGHQTQFEKGTFVWLYSNTIIISLVLTLALQIWQLSIIGVSAIIWAETTAWIYAISNYKKKQGEKT